MTLDLDVGSLGAGKVVNMQRFRSGNSLSPIRQAEAYWTALRDGASIPRRTQIDPRGLENILEYAFILERIAPGIARFRLAGQHLVRAAGMEVRGMPVSAMFTPKARAEMGGALENTFDKPAVAEISLISETRFGRSPVEAQMILLPLKSDLGDISRALGVLVCDEAQGKISGPVRFEIANTLFRPVQGLTYAVPDQEEPAPAALSVSPADAARGFAEAQPALQGKVPYLRLVKTDT